MGTCNSCESTAASPTVKVVREDGELREFAGPVKATQVLRKDPGSFVCDADGMDIGGYLAAVGADEELRPGQLYFLLPRPMLKRRLQPDEMAALAVKASAALVKGGATAVFGDGAEAEEVCGRRATTPARGFSAGSGVGPGRRHKGGGRGRNFTSKLGDIPE